jgi:hypothetical protein
VNCLRRDEEDAARGRPVPSALELEVGRALDDLSDRQRVVHVWRIAMVNEGRVERLDTRRESCRMDRADSLDRTAIRTFSRCARLPRRGSTVAPARAISSKTSGHEQRYDSSC